jgi:hypothetical protein
VHIVVSATRRPARRHPAEAHRGRHMLEASSARAPALNAEPAGIPSPAPGGKVTRDGRAEAPG